MKNAGNVIIILLLFAASGFCVRDVAFLGLTGTQAPAIEKTFSRHFLEHLAMMPEVRALNSIEVARLRERTSANFSIGSMTPAFFTSLKRFSSDSMLLIWGRVKECTVKPARFWGVGSGIKGSLTMELSIYDLAVQDFVFSGDASVATFVKKGIVLWWPVEKAIQIAAQERAQVIDKLEIKSVSACGQILYSLLLHETNQQNKKGKWPTDKREKATVVEQPAAIDTLHQEPLFEEDPVDFEIPDSTAANPEN
jgi:hypothetical protein